MPIITATSPINCPPGLSSIPPNTIINAPNNIANMKPNVFILFIQHPDRIIEIRSKADPKKIRHEEICCRLRDFVKDNYCPDDRKQEKNDINQSPAGAL